MVWILWKINSLLKKNWPTKQLSNFAKLQFLNDKIYSQTRKHIWKIGKVGVLVNFIILELNFKVLKNYSAFFCQFLSQEKSWENLREFLFHKIWTYFQGIHCRDLTRNLKMFRIHGRRFVARLLRIGPVRFWRHNNNWIWRHFWSRVFAVCNFRQTVAVDDF